MNVSFIRFQRLLDMQFITVFTAKNMDWENAFNYTTAAFGLVASCVPISATCDQ